MFLFCSLFPIGLPCSSNPHSKMHANHFPQILIWSHHLNVSIILTINPNSWPSETLFLGRLFVLGLQFTSLAHSLMISSVHLTVRSYWTICKPPNAPYHPLPWVLTFFTCSKIQTPHQGLPGSLCTGPGYLSYLISDLSFSLTQLQPLWPGVPWTCQENSRLGAFELAVSSAPNVVPLGGHMFKALISNRSPFRCHLIQNYRWPLSYLPVLPPSMPLLNKYRMFFYHYLMILHIGSGFFLFCFFNYLSPLTRSSIKARISSVSFTAVSPFLFSRHPINIS